MKSKQARQIKKMERQTMKRKKGEKKGKMINCKCKAERGRMSKKVVVGVPLVSFSNNKFQ